jgi:hypothetical protein
MNPVFYGKVSRGVLLPEKPATFRNYLSSLEGKEVSIAVKKKSIVKPRSLNENNYYWGVVLALISATTGYEPEEVHEALKHKFLRRPGPKLDRILSTAGLDTIDFEKYLEKIRLWAATELEIVIPLPNEVEV